MSALFSAPREESGGVHDSHDGDTIVAGTPVTVRRRAGLAALIGAAASAVAIAYLWRASQTMTALDWSLCAFMAVVAGYYLTSLVDARTPLAVADDLGVRIRLGNEWRGLPWDAIRQVAVHPRRGLLRDGRIVFAPHSLARAVDGLEGKAKRHASLNQKLYGAALAVPVGVTTRVSTAGELSVVDQISALSLGRAEVLEVVAAPEKTERSPKSEPKSEPPPVGPPEQAPGPDSERGLERTARRAARRETATGRAREKAQERTRRRAAVAATSEERAGEPQPAARRHMLGGIATIVSRVGKTRHPAADREAGGVPLEPAASTNGQAGADAPAAASPAAPTRETRRAQRAEVTREAPATIGNAALHVDDDSRAWLPEARDLRRPGSVDLVFEPAPRGAERVRAISQLGAPVAPLIIDDFVTEPAYDPVIGPELTAARTRLGLSVDDLADRTRIRPHVIESIEVDDFSPCGGDFYARGHLRTLARVLGKDPEPFLTSFEDRYATAPINARRVFEAELATGMRGSMRSTVGGPNWGLLVGVVLALILVWGVVRFFSAEPAELVQNPAPVLNGSAGLGSSANGGPEAGITGPVAEPVPVTLVAAHGTSQVVVRNGDGRIIFSGELALGEKKRLDIAPPVRVRATDGGAVELSIRGQDRGVLGQLGEPGNRTFR